MTIRLIVSNMITIQDYNNIVQKLKKHTGIKNIEGFSKKTILTITYYPAKINKDAICYLIVKLGYKLYVIRSNIYTARTKTKKGWCVQKNSR